MPRKAAWLLGMRRFRWVTPPEGAFDLGSYSDCPISRKLELYRVGFEINRVREPYLWFLVWSQGLVWALKKNG